MSARTSALGRRFLVSLFLLPLPILAAEVFTPQHVAKLRSVSQVAMSPDGAQIAYVLTVPRRPLEDDDGPAWAELHLVGRDGLSRSYLSGEVNVSEIAWTPDGRSIAFLAKRGKDAEIGLYIIPASGGEARRLVAHGAEITGYRFRPDGKRVAFLAKEEKPKKLKDLEKKGFNQEIVDESATPVRIWITAVDDASASPKFLEVEGSASELHWSPSGDRLAVALAPSSLVDDSLMSRKLTVVEADSGRISARIDNPGKLGPVAWSPDGTSLAFVSAADLHDPSAGRLMIAPAAGGAPKDLLPGYAGDVSRFAWQSAEFLMYLGEEGVETTLAKVRNDGTARKTLIPAGGPTLIAFHPAKDGMSAAMIAQSPQHPSEVFLSTHRAPTPKRLTSSNPWLSTTRLAPQEIVRFSARDGLALEGLLIRPLDERKGQRYPLILTVHGGPESHYSSGWLTSYSNPGQLAAARGFAVFYPNYRGSTGRGVAFAKRGQGDAAGKEFDDLVDAVDHLIAIGLVDRSKVGVTGGSYGGYATAWCSTRYSDRFAAGVMFVGISDMVSKAGTTDIPNEEYLVHSRKRPWEDWQLKLDRSPIYHVEKARTPLLILDGKDDPRVHPSQSLVLYRYLKALGRAPVRLVYYPGEKHGNRRDASRYDYNLRMIQWFEHYLKGPGGTPPPNAVEYGETNAEDAAR